MDLIGFHRPVLDVKVTNIVTVCWFLALVRGQPPPSLSLPADVLVVPPWRSLPVSQADLGVLFTNSSPFSFTQSLLLRPLGGAGSNPTVRAALGPYTVTQMISAPIVPFSPAITASLLTRSVTRGGDSDREQQPAVHVLFHTRGDSSTASCITLHAFKDTGVQRASCVTQPSLGLCVVTLTLPKDWFDADQSNQQMAGQPHQQRHVHRHRLRYQGRGRGKTPAGLQANSRVSTNRIQLYYSSHSTAVHLRRSPPRCEEDNSQQSQGKFNYIGSVSLDDKQAEGRKTKHSFSCLDGQEGEELWLDSNVLIHYQRGPVRVGQPIRMSVNLRSNFSGESIVIRLKVKRGLLSLVAQPLVSSQLWMVTMERDPGSKYDTISIACHKISTHIHSIHIPEQQQVACLYVDALRRSFGVAMTVVTSWWVEYSGRNTPVSPHGAVNCFISFTDRDIVGITPITESDTIINTAILTSQPVSVPVTVLAVGLGGKVSDVTSAVRCQSTNEDIVKVSSDCAALFVDGSESGTGSTCVGVDFSLGMLSGSLCVAVWAPVVPLRVSLSDSLLSPIRGWSHLTNRGCTPVYQRSTVQVLAQFCAQSSARKDQLTYMLGSPDWFVDVTALVRDWLRIENPRVAALDENGYLIGLEPGSTSLHVISNQWDGMLGNADITVTNDPVTPGDLTVQVVGGLGLSVNPSLSHPSVVTATVTAHNALHNYGQEASVSVWLQFSDDTATLLSAFSSIPHSLRLTSLAESVVVVTPEPPTRIIAQGDGGGPLLKAELLVPICKPVSNHIDLDERRGGGETRRLTKGSGWIRVNLDIDHWQIEGEDAAFEMLDISDMLLESDKDFYTHAGNKDLTENPFDNYNDVSGNEMVARNVLERAVLTPNHEETAVYISSGTENEPGGRKYGERELEIGVGAILSLLLVSSLLFLVNCLPCALREHADTERQVAAVEHGLGGEEVTIEEKEQEMNTEDRQLREEGQMHKQEREGKM